MSTTTDILDFLKDGAFTGAEIADAINSDTSTVSALCNGLVKRGLVVASKDGGKNTYTRVDGDRVPTPAPTRSAAPEAGSRKPEAGQHAKPAQATASTKPKGKAKPAASEPAKRLRALTAAAESPANVRAALEFAHGTACDALNLYLRSVVNPAIYDDLVAARDRSRSALDAFIGADR